MLVWDFPSNFCISELNLFLFPLARLESCWLSLFPDPIILVSGLLTGLVFSDLFWTPIAVKEKSMCSFPCLGLLSFASSRAYHPGRRWSKCWFIWCGFSVALWKFVKLVPGRNIDQGIHITDLLNKTGCTSNVFDAVQHKSKYHSGLSCTCNHSLSACPLANASLPFWSEDKECMHSDFLNLLQVCCPHPFSY